MADLVLVVAVTDREAKTAAHGISLFMVENGTKGFQKGRKLEKIGLKAQVPEPHGLGGIVFQDAVILSSHCLFSFFQRTQPNCFLRMCGSQPTPSWGESTRVSTT